MTRVFMETPRTRKGYVPCRSLQNSKVSLDKEMRCKKQTLYLKWIQKLNAINRGCTV